MRGPYSDRLLVRTKLTPPRLHRHTLPRPRLTRRLLEAVEYRLALVQAGTGYGKSTALAALVREPHPLVWYHLDREDADPLVFLLHLIHGFAAALPGMSQAPLALLEEWERDGGNGVWATVVDMLVGELHETLRHADGGKELFLVLDDAHRLSQTTESLRILDRLIGRAPPQLHVILSTRYPLKLPSLVRWRVRGEVLEIGEEELAFTAGETIQLFRDQYGYALSAEQAGALMAQVEGWPITLPLVWQRLRGQSGGAGGDEAALDAALGQLSGATSDLFRYLAQEVLQQQPQDVQHFLALTAVLRQMTVDTCDCLRQATDSEQLLDYLRDNGLFVVDLGDGHLRYHHLFRELLLQQLQPAEAEEAHARAAACFRERGDEEEAIYHLLAAGRHEQAAQTLCAMGRRLVRAGRLDRLAGWLGSLPPDVLQANPPLLAYMGDIARLRSRFNEALGWYRQAEEGSRLRGDVRGVGQALRGQARVYLDTVNPSRAEALLQEALRLSDGQEDRESRARLLELLAENLLNQGRLEQARAYQEQAREVRDQGPAEAALSTRVLLRTGRLDEALWLLQERAEAERREPVLRPRAHRETLLLLSLIHSFRGERDAAYQTAIEGTERGRQFNSPFVTAVGHMRQGHAWLLDKTAAGYAQAAACFQKANDISAELGVPRLRVEAAWGLCQAYGFRGQLETAEQIAQEGMEIARSAGDEWVEACIRVTMGAALVLAERYDEAAPWLAQAATAFRACADTYGEAVVRLWQCLMWQATDDEARLARDVRELLRLARTHGYDYLFLRRTLMSPPEPRALAPLLLFGRRLANDGRLDDATTGEGSSAEAVYAQRLLAEMGLAGVEIHPGYQLRVQLLGPFRLWRGREEVPAAEWTRQKARQLFHLMLTCRDTLLEREQMTEMLWPELDPESALRDFKIAYSTLCRVLEPERRRNAPSAFVMRDDSRYGLRPEADIWLDTAEFDRLLAQGEPLIANEEGREAGIDHYRQALALYQGDYLQEYPYAEWASEERERLLTQYLRAAERLATTLVDEQAWDEAIGVCQAILARDDCWEQAYRLLMLAYAGQGNRPQALRTFQRCTERLQAELGVGPMPATIRIYEQIMEQGS